MAKGRKTGGRDFKKGQGGRKKGAKDKVPRGRSLKASIKAVLLDVIAEKGIVEKCIRNGLKAAPQHAFHYLQLAAYYADGKPTESVRMIDLSKLSEETLERIATETSEP